MTSYCGHKIKVHDDAPFDDINWGEKQKLSDKSII